MIPPDSLVNKTHVFNQEFVVISGAQYWDGADVNFPARRYEKRSTLPGAVGIDGCYRTCWGGVQHTGVLYGNCNESMRLALRRLTGARGDDVFAHTFLKARQTQWIADNTWLYAMLRRHYTTHWHLDYQGMIEEARQRHADPHPKRHLRICGWEALLDNDRGLNPQQFLWLRKVWTKLKKDEYAKNGSYPRCIGDLGVLASLQGFVLFDRIKGVMADRPVNVDGIYMYFIKSSSLVYMKAAFKRLHLCQPLPEDGLPSDPRAVIVYFSDDAAISIQTPTGPIWFEMDISKCDLSHTDAHIDQVAELVPTRFKNDTIRALSQLGCPFEVRDCTNLRSDKTDQRRRVKFRGTGKVLHSGHTATTVLNNLAIVLIGTSLSRFNIPFEPSNAHNTIVDAALRVGYLVTVDHRRDFRSLTFLKHYPVLVSGEWVPLLCLGVFLRSFRQCHGDLPGRVNGRKATFHERALAFDAALIRSMYPAHTHELIERLREYSGAPSLEAEQKIQRESRFSAWYSGTSSQPPTVVDNEQTYARYGLTSAQCHRLIERFGGSQFEECVTGPEEQRILQIDYELDCQVALPPG